MARFFFLPFICFYLMHNKTEENVWVHLWKGERAGEDC